ncbi:unnamed protein product [Owenia fusiformis]|uniref:G-protein coupled receptors family 1 profile domain-containing protein n=1 Tax=Owenia fusiformis TaxID=6347 RepID=A0A8S4NNS8_OWEFU|nr:unnamed protein product [Owenia fusiformis]
MGYVDSASTMQMMKDEGFKGNTGIHNLVKYLNMSNKTGGNDTVIHSPDNVTNTIDTDNSIDVSKAVGIGISMGLIVLCSFLGNILVVLAVTTNIRLRTITNYFIVSLAISDLLVSILVMPLSISVIITDKWYLGFYVCEMWITLDVMLCTSSILNLCCISVDRYFAITRPLAYASKRSKRLALVMIGVVWILSVLITLPPIFGWQEQGRGNNEAVCMLTSNPGYIIYSSMGSFWVPMAIMLFVYSRIFKVTREREKRLRPYRRSIMLSRQKSADVNTSSSTEDNSQEYESEDLKSHLRTNSLWKRNNNPPSSEQIIGTRLSCPRKNSLVALQNTTEKNNGAQTPIFSRNRPSFYRDGGHLSNGRTPLFKFKSSKKDDKRRERFHLLKEKKAAKTLAIVVGAFTFCWLPFFIMYVTMPFCKHCSIHPVIEVLITWLGYCNSVINPCIYAFYNKDFRYSFWKLTFGQFSNRDRESAIHL